ncbi:MAG: hypothetical protein ACREFK_19060 [Stellaceae bacterium]
MPFGKWASGLADKLNYGTALADGVILTKCGSFVAGWFYRGIDAASATDQELNAHAERVNAALSRMGGGWAIWPIASRFETDVYPPPEASHFPDPISRMVDDERREQFEEPGAHFETELAILVMYTPPRRRYSRLAELLYAEAGQLRESFADRVLERFQRDLATIEDALAGALTLRRMGALTLPDGAKSDELVNFINHCLTGRQLALPPLGLRLGGHFGPVFRLYDPVLKQLTFMGCHVSRTARIEPVTPEGAVYVTDAFAAALATANERRFVCNYMGVMPAAKDYSPMRMFALSRRNPDY